MAHSLDPAQLTPLLDAGYQLIPLHRWDARATCHRTGRTRERGKSPLHPNWTGRTYASAEQVEHMRRGGNVGVRLRPGDLVVDVDPRNLDGGAPAVPAALRALGVDPDAFPWVTTGGGGLHLYMRKPRGLSIVDGLREFPGVEFKTVGRQVVAPGSLHPSGRPYVWSSGADGLWLGTPRAPEALLRLIRRPRAATVARDTAGEHPPEEVEVILARLDPETFRDHDRWLKLMMAVHHASAGEAREEFVAWCTRDPLYADDAPEVAYRWDSLRGHGVGLGTLYMFMREAGAGHLIDRRPRYDFPDDLHQTEVAP
jgi:hypothetical protein